MDLWGRRIADGGFGHLVLPAIPFGSARLWPSRRAQGTVEPRGHDGGRGGDGGKSHWPCSDGAISGDDWKFVDDLHIAATCWNKAGAST